MEEKENATQAMCVAIIAETLLGIAYLAYSAYLLSFGQIIYTIGGLLLFMYAVSSIGGFESFVEHVVRTNIDKKIS